jgi:hypothetical protein
MNTQKGKSNNKLDRVLVVGSWAKEQITIENIKKKTRYRFMLIWIPEIQVF